MNEPEIRRLMSLDEELPEDRHDLIKERVMNTIRNDQPAEGSESARPARVRRRFAPALASVFAVLIAGTAVAGALGLFPQQTTEILDEAGCRNTDSIERLVAEAPAPDGGTHQFWITSATEAAAPNGHILIELRADGSLAGSAGGCGPPDMDLSEYYGEMWAVVPNTVSADGAVGSVMGHVPAEAATAVVTFGDGTSVEIETQTDGYFLAVVSRSDISGDALWPDVVHISALDSNGVLVADEVVE